MTVHDRKSDRRRTGNSLLPRLREVRPNHTKRRWYELPDAQEQKGVRGLPQLCSSGGSHGMNSPVYTPLRPAWLRSVSGGSSVAGSGKPKPETKNLGVDKT
jgi:hypothetical protein